MELFWFVFISIFVVGTIILAATKKFERHFIFFLIRTKLFLNFIDKIARIFPKLWKFIADLAIIFSFSGIGAAYLSKYRYYGKNLDFIFFLIGFFVIFFSSENLIFFSLSFLSLILLTLTLRKIKKVEIDFLVFSSIISLFWLKVFLELTKIGLLAILDKNLLILLSFLAGIFGIPGLLILIFIYQGYLILFQNFNIPSVSPFIPATKGGEIGISAPGTGIFIPIWYAFVAIVITIISHEFAHGIIAKAHNIKLKSTGILTFGILPLGAFVEPDEKELEMRESLERMRIFSVGSFANFIVGLIFFIMLMFSSILFSQFSDGITVVDTQKGYPAFNVLKRGMVISEINSEPTKKLEEFVNAMKKVKPNEEIKIKINTGEIIKLKTMSNPNKIDEAYLGIILVPHIPDFILETLFWIFFINLNIALANLLPIIPLDGGRMLKEIIFEFEFRKFIAEKIVYGVLAIILVLLIINMFPLFNIIVNFFL